MASIAGTVARIKDDARGLLDVDLVTQACVEAGHDWRVRRLDPVMTLSLMLLQTLHGTSCRGVLRVANLACSASAYCQAKRRLPLAVLHRLFFELACRAGAARESVGRWKEHRVLLIDGSSVSMPDTQPLRRRFGLPTGVKKGSPPKPGFPVMHLLGLFDQASGMIVDLIGSHQDTHDLRHASKLHPMMKEGDVLLGDRGFCSFAHLCLVLQENLHAVFRVQHAKVVDFRPNRADQKRLPKNRRKGRPTSIYLKRLGHYDQWVRYVKPKACPPWMGKEGYAQLPKTITVRELRYTLGRRGFRTHQITLVTTLLDAEKYSKQDLADLYASRWEVETRLKELKQTLGANVLRSTTPEGVMKDLWTYLLVYNLIR